MTQDIMKPLDFFQLLNRDSMYLVDEFYDKDILFRDPMVEIKNRDDMKAYYTRMYQNVKTISWQFPEDVTEGNVSTLSWKMTLTATNFNGEMPVTVDGISVIKFGGSEGKAIYHRDYFDMGAFVYEGLPILGKMVKIVKSKMASYHGHA